MSPALAAAAQRTALLLDAHRLPRPLAFAGVAIAAAGVYLGLAAVLPVGVDYYWWYYRVPLAWRLGETQLYDAASRQFFSPPWSLVLFVPLTFLPIEAAMAVLTIGSLLMVTAVPWAWARGAGARWPALIAVLVALNEYTFNALFTGNPDPWSLLGIAGCYWSLQRRQGWLLGASVLLATVRPQNTVLLLPALALAAWQLPRGPLLRAGGVVAAALLCSIAAAGWDWPLRWWESYRTLPPTAGGLVATSYSLAERVGIPFPVTAVVVLLISIWVLRQVRRHGLTERTFELVIAAGAVATPYLRSPGYVPLLGLPWAGLAARSPWRALVPYLISVPNLVIVLFLWDSLHGWWGQAPWLEVLFPIALLAMLALDQRASATSKTAVAGAVERQASAM